MKLLIMGDAHLRSGKPEKRLDNYEENQYKKMCWIMKKAEELGCVYILQPGDLTEHSPFPRMNFETLARYMKLFNIHSPTKILTVFGQHDMKDHQISKNTPLHVLDTADSVVVLNHHKFLPSPSYAEKPILVYGCSYGDPIPDPTNMSAFNILVIHTMVSDKDYWDGHVPYNSPQNLLEQLPEYDLVVSGDNHHSFQYFTEPQLSSKRQGLINCGSLMRSSIDQINHMPCVWCFDTDTFSARQFNIPIQPYHEVFDMEAHEETKRKKLDSEAFVERLEQGFESSGLDFVKNLEQAKREQEAEVQALIEEAQHV